MKRIEDITMKVNKDYLVQFSNRYVLDKALTLTVPRGYVAIVYVNGKAMVKLQDCVKEKVFDKLGKEYLGKEVQFAFYLPSMHPTISYGFGPIHINNDRLKEAYRIGINGQMSLTIQDYVGLIKYFAFSNSITVEEVREKMIPIIKTVGMPIVDSYFVNTKVSVFEINSLITDIRAKMEGSFQDEKTFKNMGVKVDSVAINEIFVNEEDLEMIRNRINN